MAGGERSHVTSEAGQRWRGRHAVGGPVNLRLEAASVLRVARLLPGSGQPFVEIVRALSLTASSQAKEEFDGVQGALLEVAASSHAPAASRERTGASFDSTWHRMGRVKTRSSGSIADISELTLGKPDFFRSARLPRSDFSRPAEQIEENMSS